MAKRNTYYMENANGDVFSTMHPEYHQQCEPLPRAKGAEMYRAQCIKETLKLIKPGTTVYCNIVSVSSSGMTRRISFYVITNGRLVNIDHRFAVITGWNQSDKGGIVVSGCGMDMCFHAVYTLGRYLWPKGTKKPHGARNGAPDTDGGYALKHSTL